MQQRVVRAQGVTCARKKSEWPSTILVGLVAFLSTGLAEPLGTAGWVSRFRSWHRLNEFRALASPNSANLAWFEANLLRSYLNLYQATGDTGWLERFTFHADSVLALMRDFPEGGNCWSGYQDGFSGWGTTRYDPQGRYQEYLVHDAVISLPLARFARLVYQNPGLQGKFLAQAQRYREKIEANIVAKWQRNWDARRGRGEDLESFGGWQNLPVNQFLAFGELLLVLSDVRNTGSLGRAGRLVPDAFYTAVPESMAALFYAGLSMESDAGAWVWNHWPITIPDPRPEDVSHANLDISFTLEATAHRLLFNESDLHRFAQTFIQLVWQHQTDPVQFSRFVNGRGGPDSVLALEDWVRLTTYEPLLLELVSGAVAAIPCLGMNVSMASTVAQIAALTANGRQPTANDSQPRAESGELRELGVSAMASRFGLRESGLESLRLFDRSGRAWSYQSVYRLPQGVYFGQFDAGRQIRVRPVLVVR